MDWIIRSFVDGLQVSGIYELSKRLLDIIGAIFGLVILLYYCPSWHLQFGWTPAVPSSTRRIVWEEAVPGL